MKRLIFPFCRGGGVCRVRAANGGDECSRFDHYRNVSMRCCRFQRELRSGAFYGRAHEHCEGG